MKTVCVYHSIDLDGWMSAAIVKHWFVVTRNNSYNLENSIIEESRTEQKILNQLDFIGYNYGQPIPDLSEYDRVIMCDISFPKEEMVKLWDKLGVGNMIWIDHHISAIKDIQDAKWLWTGMQDTKFAACELTWKYFFPDGPMPEIVRLFGLYDSFRHKGTDEEQYVLHVQYGARSVISNYEQSYEWLKYALKDEFLSTYEGNAIHQQLESRGLHIYDYLCTEAKQAYKNGFEIRLDQLNSKYYTGNRDPREIADDTWRFICINKERFNPINFGIDYHKDGYDGAACFHYANGKWNFSLYNDNGEVDCSLIAKQYGGGGHKGAAGFVTTDINSILTE